KIRNRNHPKTEKLPSSTAQDASLSGHANNGRSRKRMAEVSSQYVVVEGAKTHFLHAGKGFPVVLLHSGEFGGCAELSWERNIEALAEEFEVFAPDWLGYGRTAKLFSFEDMWELRVRHIASFLRTVCVGKAHFIGNSMGGTMLLATAALGSPPWPMEKIVV